MKRIPLTQNKYAIIDNKDYEKLSNFKWCFNGRYASRSIWINGKSKTIYMHREIMKTPKGMLTDHKNLNKLDNQRKNLRICNNSENNINRNNPKNNSSGFRGVSWHKGNKKWQAMIAKNKIVKHLGCFDTKEEAAIAYNNEAKKLFKNYARVNIIINKE